MPVSSTDYRNAISRFLSGVSVVTSRHAGVAQGITASAVCSVTLEPPTLLVCLNRQSATCQAVTESGNFCVNVLGEQQRAVAQIFSTKSKDKFAELEAIEGEKIVEGESGTPLLRGAIAQLECRVTSHTDVGTHRIFFGEVLATAASDGEPLAYFRGQFAALERTK